MKKKYTFYSNIRGVSLYCWAYSKKQALVLFRNKILINTGNWDSNLNTLNIKEVE